jgi:hypothetical protein
VPRALLLAAIVVLALAPSAGAANRAKLAEISASPSGSGAGQLFNPSGGAVNPTGAGGVSAGDYYVADRGNNRVARFHADGEFVAVFGLGVDQTTGGDVCTAESHDTCKAGAASSAAGSVWNPTGTAVDQAGNVYVYSLDSGITGSRRVNVFSAEGAFEGAFGWNVISGGAEGTGTLKAGSTSVESVVTTKKAFQIGQTILGEGIPAGTTITQIATGVGAASRLTLSQAATEARSGDVLTVAEAAGNVPGDERQRLTVASTASAGSFTLRFRTTSPTVEAETAAIPWDATAAEVEAALAGLANVGASNVAVTLDPGGDPGGGPGPGGPWTVEFTGPRLGDTNVEELTVATQPTGGTVAATTLRDGGELEFCTTSSGCISGEGNAPSANGSAGEFTGASNTRTLAVDAGGDLYVPNTGELRLDRFSPILGPGSEVVGVEFVRGIGWGVDASAPEERLQVCTTSGGCQRGAPGNGPGQFTAENPVGVAVDSGGDIYAVAGARTNGNCTAAEPCRVEKFNPDGTFAGDFGPASGACRLTYEGGEPAQTVEALALAVDPAGQNLLVLKKTGANEMQVCEFAPDGTERGLFPAAPLPVTSATAIRAGLAVGAVEPGQTEARVYAVNGSPAVYILGPVPPPGAEILPVTEIGENSAELNGKVTVPAPGGEGFETRYRFELSADGGFHWTRVPEPDASAGSVAGTYEVHQTATGLQPNAHYLVRLTAVTGPSVTSAEERFSTGAAPPSVAYAPGANPLTDVIDPFGPTTAKLAGYVNPNNSPTTYRFEYGSTVAYGSQSPAEFEPAIGEGGEAVPVKATLIGLTPRTTYHFRIVARNASGSTVGPDRQFTTAEAPQSPGSCGLPDNRCFELVSPVEKGPVAVVGGVAGNFELTARAAPQGSAVAYTLGYGLPDSTASPEVLYQADRGASGWTSTQLASPAQAAGEERGGGAWSGRTKFIPDNLSCGIVASASPLVPGAPGTVVEAGGTNLYRRDNHTGSYQLITVQPPVNAAAVTAGESPPIPLSNDEYTVVGSDAGCDRIVFATPYRYPGLVGPDSKSYIYEWDQGTLRNVGLVPGGAGEVLAEAVPGAGRLSSRGITSGGNYWRSVSSDASRVFFTAPSRSGNDAGNAAVFARLDGTRTLDVSRSALAVDTGATYEGASTDGSRVFFLANAGLTPESGTAGTDLYECHIVAVGGEDSCDLSDLSVDRNPSDAAGAAVAAVVGISADGSYVYFAAAGQLLTGQGRSYAENQRSASLNLYVAHEGEMKLAGLLASGDLERASRNGRAAVGEYSTARVTDAGRRLLFETAESVTGYANRGVREAYLFSYDTGGTVCVSCVRGVDPIDPPLAFEGPLPLVGAAAERQNEIPRSITSDGQGGVRIFFESLDALTPAAQDEEEHLYEWENGQTYLIAGVPVGETLQFADAGDEARDAYLVTNLRLSPEDPDGRPDLYDLRIDGGFPPPPQAPPACDPLAEGGCGPGGEPGPPPLGPPPTSVFAGGGNVAKAKHRRHHAHKRRRRHKRASRHGHHRKRPGNAGRRAGK